MTKNKTKIYCFLASVAKGGMERQMIIIMEQLVARGYDVTLVTFSPRKDMYSYSGKIHRVNLASKSGGKLRSFLNIRKFFKKVVTSNDVIISFGTAINVIALVATLGLKRHIIVVYRNLPGDNLLEPLAEICAEFAAGDYKREELIAQIYEQIHKLLDIGTF